MDVYLFVIGVLITIIAILSYIIWRFLLYKKTLVNIINILTSWVIDVYTTYGVDESEEQVTEFTNKLKEITKGI